MEYRRGRIAPKTTAMGWRNNDAFTIVALVGEAASPLSSYVATVTRAGASAS